MHVCDQHIFLLLWWFWFSGVSVIQLSRSFLGVGSRGAGVSAALSKRKAAGLIPTIGDFHTVCPCKKAVFACLATNVKARG